jgi:hypothetical protein
MTLPRLALSVRQPWAWAIIHAGKNIENRSWNRRYKSAHGAALDFRGRVCIHASKGMTRHEYAMAIDVFRSAGVAHLAPSPDQLLRGGIIGTVEIIDVVSQSHSPWFFGPKGLLLRDPQPVEFIPCRGELGYFEWHRDDDGVADPPARWMLPPGARPETASEAADRQWALL